MLLHSQKKLQKKVKDAAAANKVPKISIYTVISVGGNLPTPEEQQWVVRNWPTQLRNMYVISIRERRLAAFKSRMGPLMSYVTVVNGVDGSLIDKDDMIRKKLYRPLNANNDLTRGQIGCFQSHASVWEHFLSTDNEYACIMEDDLNLSPRQEIASHIQTGITELAGRWNLLFLSRNPDLCMGMKLISPHNVIAQRSWGLFFYVISKNAAKILLSKSRPITYAADIFVSTTIPGVALYPRACSVLPELSDTAGIK